MIKNKVFACLLAILLVRPLSLAAVDPGMPKWYGNDHFKITRINQVVKVSMDKKPWETFSMALAAVPAAKLLSLEVKTLEPVSLRIDGWTAGEQQITLFHERITAGQFQQLAYDLSASKQKFDYLIFYVNPGKAFKGEVIFRNVGLRTLAAAQPIRLSPNPAAGLVQIALPHPGFSQILLYDAQGKLMVNKAISGMQTQIEVSGLPAGVYNLQAKGAQLLRSTRLVVR